MGGCRCTYKNCTLRTDGVTHMFHYPVFDKVRCHQWLTNAQKLEFLNLKVSQLKNRVVCQHHFKDDNFMNFLKDKLTFDAVPTEDGPYCDSSQLASKKPVQEDSKLYSISLEDIENEYLTFNDKKANFSVKYGDFLTNCDLMDLDSMNLSNDNTQIITKDKSLEETNDIILNDNINRKKVATINPITYKTIDTVQPKINSNCLSLKVSEVPIEIEGLQASLMMPNINVASVPNVPQTVDQRNNIHISTGNLRDLPKKKNSKSLLKEKKKITILEEQKISEPVSVQFPVKLESICPSTVLPLPTKRKSLYLSLGNTDNYKHNNSIKIVAPDFVRSNNIVEQDMNVTNNTKQVQTVKVPEQIDNIKHTAPANRESQETIIKTINISQPKAQSNVVSGKKPNNSLLKTKIPPERMAAIEEKRKFNMKLRDIIASCLDKLDDEEAKDCDNSKLKSKIENNITQKVSSYLSKEPELPALQDYTVAYLEARMKKMENLLLHKIDQNSQRIAELKQSFVPLPDKKVAHTQTVLNEELQKKHLYEEISKFLSPEANSLLYEELFINKYAPKLSQKCSPAKKRKCR